MGGHLRFQLNGSWRNESAVPPTTTLLDYLRENARLTGTKEGCAEGDCGACTVVIGLPRAGNQIVYSAVNSCLMLLPQVDGHAVVTVEGLAQPDGTLHPVQQALIRADATQCGFCTPGFAMAMFALTNEDEIRTDEIIHDALAGNLCRCTGYRPIVDAARAASFVPPGCGAVVDAPRRSTSDYRSGSQRYLAPETLDELVEVKAKYPDAILLGGGTDLGIRVSKEREAFPVVISTGWVEALAVITEDQKALTLGGAVTYTRALPALEKYFPSFAKLVRRIGSRQIRNIGTVAGNLATASPIGDTIPCLIALHATIRLRSKRGVRDVPADRFVPGYRRTVIDKDEVIESISIPLLQRGTTFTACKLSKRFDQDISTVIAAFRIRVENDKVGELRAAYGGMGPLPARAKNVEEAVTGRPWNAETLAGLDAALAKDFSPITDHRGTAEYRLLAAANLMRRLLAEAGSSEPCQVWEL
jgi:xanthine dehydrogenase small subunit